jgi:Sec-independent protein translocase protein TatA
MGLGTEILFILILGLLLLGPKQLHRLLGDAGRAKAQFEETSRRFKSQLAADTMLRIGREKQTYEANCKFAVLRGIFRLLSSCRGYECQTAATHIATRRVPIQTEE